MKHKFDIFLTESNEIFANVYQAGDGSYVANGFSSRGIEWANWLNSSKSLDIESTLPPYVEIHEVLNGDDIRELTKSIPVVRLLASHIESTKSILPQIRSAQLVGISPDSRDLVINYKARAFSSDAESASILAQFRMKGLSYNPLTGTIVGPPSLGMQEESDHMYGNYQPGLVRNDAISVLNQKTSKYDGKQYPLQPAVSEKGAFRRMSRSISQRFDPNAIDADGDMLIQEGTPFQRPARPQMPNQQGRVGAARSFIMGRRGMSGDSKPKEVGKTTQRSSGSISFGTSPSRARSANIDRTSRARSLPAQLSGSKSTTRKNYVGNPGIDRASPEDGKIWSKLTPEERATVARRARALEDQRFYQLTGVTPGGANMPFRKRFLATQRAAEAKGEKLDGPTKDLLEEMQSWVEEYANKQSIPEKARLEVHRFYDELLALYNMRTMKDSDPYEFIEHLHPSGKKFLFDDEKRSDGAKTSVSPKQKSITSESTAFLRVGGYEKGSPISANTRKPGEGQAASTTDDRLARAIDTGSRKLINRLLNPRPKKK